MTTRRTTIAAGKKVLDESHAWVLMYGTQPPWHAEKSPEPPRKVRRVMSRNRIAPCRSWIGERPQYEYKNGLATLVGKIEANVQIGKSAKPKIKNSRKSTRKPINS